jgi:hypothetical protein
MQMRQLAILYVVYGHCACRSEVQI